MSKIVLEDFNEGNGYYKVNLAYLSKKQVEEIEALVSKWNPTDEDIKSCIGMCLTDVNEQKFKDYNTSLKDCLSWLEKQKPAWSEDDECYMSECIGAIATKDGWSFEEKRKTKHWLESLKQRIGE